MGNPVRGESPISARGAAVPIQHYFSSRMWIEGAALAQLDLVAGLRGVTSVAAFPDLHPGKYGPAGIAVQSRRLHPQLIGNDIGCGMSLFELDLSPHKLKLDRAVERLRGMEAENVFDPADELAALNLPGDMYSQALGTIGGGNHFCELQAVHEVFGEAEEAVVDPKRLHLLVHSGSRGLGVFVFGQTLDLESVIENGFDPLSADGLYWRRQHDLCVAWASLNRRMIAARAASALRCEARLVSDVPHNLVREGNDGFVHYKGAATVRPGDISPVAGSRASLSYVVRALDAGASLGGISHGAGRKYDRATMHGRAGRNRSERDALMRNEWGGQAICDDRNLVVEEAASAYKDAGQVVRELADAGLVEPLAAMKPLVTYKKALDGPPDRTRGKASRERSGRRSHDERG